MHRHCRGWYTSTTTASIYIYRIYNYFSYISDCSVVIPCQLYQRATCISMSLCSIASDCERVHLLRTISPKARELTTRNVSLVTDSRVCSGATIWRSMSPIVDLNPAQQTKCLSSLQNTHKQQKFTTKHPYAERCIFLHRRKCIMCIKQVVVTTCNVAMQSS